MKTIIAGSRSITDKAAIFRLLDELPWIPTEVVSGTAAGVDSIGEEWAAARDIPVTRFPAEWNKFGKRAGYIRNTSMSHYAKGLVLFWDGVSRGSAHMLLEAQRRNLKIVLHIIKPES